MADFDAQLPVRALAVDFTTEVANAAGTTINPVEEFPQGSTTAAQMGPLDQAAVTTAAPLYVSGTTAPLSLDVNGNLRTTSTFTPSGTQDVNIVSSIPLAVTGPLTDAQLRATPVPISGTITANLGTVDGLALDATLTNGTQHTLVDNFPATQPVSGTVAVTQSTSPWVVSGSVTTSPNVNVHDGTGVSISSTGSSLNVDVTNTIPVTGTFWQAVQPVSGTVAVSNFPATVAVTQSTSPWVVSGTVTANLGTVDGLALNATLTNGTQVTSVSNFPAIQPVSGTIAVSNFPADADALAQGSSTGGQLGALEMGATTTAAPVYTTGTTNPLSLDVAGNLRVSSTVTNFPALQAVNLTEIGGNVITTTVPVSGTIAVSNFPADADALAQGSTTAGQLGALEMGAVTTAAPAYTTGQTSPLSIDTSGNLRVAATLTSPPAVLTYFLDVAVATNATVTHSVAGPKVLDKVWGMGSGEIKMTIAIGTTGSETVYFNGFTSAANQDCEFELATGYVIPSGSSVKVSLKNRDTAAQDLNITIETH